MEWGVSCKPLLDADASVLLMLNKDPNFICKELGNETESCKDWLIDSKLSLHLRKQTSSYSVQSLYFKGDKDLGSQYRGVVIKHNVLNFLD